MAGLVACVGMTLVWAPTLPGKESDHHRDFGFGRPPTESEITAWDIDIAPDGHGLPAGHGSAREGEKVYQQHCAFCHGRTGIEGPMPKLVGGQGTLNTDHPVKTVGSYWPYATTLYDYIFRAMPLTAPQSLTPNEVYAVVAWILFRNGIVEKTARIDAATLPRIQMPNRDGFVTDPRPEVPYKDSP